MYNKPFISQFSMRSNMQVSYAVFIQRMKTITRYKGSLLFDILIPTIFSLFPILMGNSIAGSEEAAAKNFGVSSGSEDYILYMIIGANIFQITSGAINNFAFFLRKEQMQGTLESIYLAPINQFFILLGTAFYTILRALFNFFVSLVLAGLIFSVNPFQGNWLLGMVFLLVGMIPIYGLSFAIGAMILKFKEMNAVQNIVTWGFSTLMGIFFPISLFPKWMLVLSYIFPPTWHNSSVKASILESSYIIRDIWLANLAVIIILAIGYPLFGMWIYTRTDRQMRKTVGLGAF